MKEIRFFVRSISVSLHRSTRWRKSFSKSALGGKNIFDSTFLQRTCQWPILHWSLGRHSGLSSPTLPRPWTSIYFCICFYRLILLEDCYCDHNLRHNSHQPPPWSLVGRSYRWANQGRPRSAFRFAWRDPIPHPQRLPAVFQVQRGIVEFCHFSISKQWRPGHLWSSSSWIWSLQGASPLPPVCTRPAGREYWKSCVRDFRFRTKLTKW